MNVKHETPSLITKTLAKLSIGDGCWEWLGGLNHGGYGRVFGEGGSATFIHRVMYEHFIGPIPDGLVIDHLCRNRKCGRPSHLEPVTRGENVTRGRDARTHCVGGHEWNEKNTHWSKKGTRQCRECGRLNAARRRADKSEKT